MAIHVQLRHEVDPNRDVIEAPQELDDDEVYIEVPAADFEEEAPRALPPVGDSFFVPKALGSGSLSARAGGVLQYLASRALNAYLTQSSYAATAEPRMLDVTA